MIIWPIISTGVKVIIRETYLQGYVHVTVVFETDETIWRRSNDDDDDNDDEGYSLCEVSVLYLWLPQEEIITVWHHRSWESPIELFRRCDCVVLMVMVIDEDEIDWWTNERQDWEKETERTTKGKEGKGAFFFTWYWCCCYHADDETSQDDHRYYSNA